MSASIHFLRPYHEAFLDEIPLIWRQPAEAPTGITLHIPDLGRRKEDNLRLLDRLADDKGRVAVSFDLPDHGARRGDEPIGKRVHENPARVLWSLLGHAILDVPTITTWARHRFGALPLELSGMGLGADVALGALRLVGGVEQVTCVGASPDWSVPLAGFGAVDGRLEGRPDARATFLRQSFEPMRHPGDYLGQRIHFLKTARDGRSAAIDAFKSRVLGLSVGEGGEIVTTTLTTTARDGVDFADPMVWWPHMSRPAA